MKRKSILTATALGMAALCVATPALADGLGFTPISGSAYDALTADWSEPFVIPAGYTQKLVADETDLDIYGDGVDDLSDMNVHNETGRQAGRFLFRTHEVGANGAVSVVDTKTGEAKIVAQDAGWRRLDGIEWTPWGTLLFAEETAGGRVFEMFFDPKDPTKAVRVETRTQLGIQRHEGIGVAADGSIHVIDELNGGSIYKFVPKRKGDLSKGQLYALKITGLADADQKYSQTSYLAKTGAYTWVPLDMAVASVDADLASNNVAATEFGRPEDVEIIGNTLYVANTSEDRVVAIGLGRSKVVTNFVAAGVNAPVEDKATKTTGFDSPDNLAKDSEGNLWIVEDNVPSDIWAAPRGKGGVASSVNHFASMVDPGAEGTGIYWGGKDGKTLYVNVQHPDKPLADGTWMIRKSWRS
jgi:uncharacterized protein